MSAPTPILTTNKINCPPTSASPSVTPPKLALASMSESTELVPSTPGGALSELRLPPE